MIGPEQGAGFLQDPMKATWSIECQLTGLLKTMMDSRAETPWARFSAGADSARSLMDSTRPTAPAVIFFSSGLCVCHAFTIQSVISLAKMLDSLCKGLMADEHAFVLTLSTANMYFNIEWKSSRD